MSSSRRAAPWRSLASIALAALLAGAGLACSSGGGDDTGTAEDAVSRTVRVTLLGTNDVHGGLEPTVASTGEPVGGMAAWAGYVKALRRGLERQGVRVLVLDGGDQFQGTLLSNYDEGELTYDLFNTVGYDAVVPGNHAYDFGPRGWLLDRPSAFTGDGPRPGPREALEHVVERARFAVLSANTYLKSSLVAGAPEGGAAPVTVDGVRCTRAEGQTPVDFTRATRPGGYRPHVVKTFDDVRVAVIGLDHPETPLTTTRENVDDLCFRDEVDTYLEVRRSLEGQADVFVLLAHDGNSATEGGLSNVVRSIRQQGGENAVHAVIAGHTHAVHRDMVEGVPIVQSGSGGERFGRVDLTWDKQARRLWWDRTRAFAGVKILLNRCDDDAAAFCRASGGRVTLEGEAVRADEGVTQRLAAARSVLAPVADRPLGEATAPVNKDRIGESPLANLITDELRAVTDAEVALVNTSGLRTSLPKGELRYEDLYKVLPFNNHAVVVSPMPASTLVALLGRSAKTCGAFPALIPSGVRVDVRRTCPPGAATDEAAYLERVTLVNGENAGSGEVLLDRGQTANRTLRVATFDFLASGGDGYEDFRAVPVTEDVGIVREAIFERLSARRPTLTPALDGRFRVRSR